jgi:hypothetical protein
MVVLEGLDEKGRRGRGRPNLFAEDFPPPDHNSLLLL